LQDENDYLNNYNNEIITKGKEKMEIFINLCMQYSRKILSVGNLIKELNNPNIESSQNIMITELINTIEKFKVIVENPKLINNLLNLPDEIEINFNFSENEINKNESVLVNIINDLENQVNSLNEEVLSYKKELTACKSQINGLSKDEVNELFQKVKLLKKGKEDCENQVNELKKINKELQISNANLNGEIANLNVKLKTTNVIFILILE